MTDELLPIGSVIRVDKYLGIIVGYLGYSPEDKNSGTSTYIEYSTVPYPFSCMNIKNVFKDYKKYEWFNFTLGNVTNDMISEVIFVGYKDEEFEKAKTTLENGGNYYFY